VAEEAEAALGGGRGDLGRGGAQHLIRRRRRIMGPHSARGGALAWRRRGGGAAGRRGYGGRGASGVGWGGVMRAAACGGRGEKDGETLRRVGGLGEDYPSG
jgi:hypothetical protein